MYLFYKFIENKWEDSKSHSTSFISVHRWLQIADNNDDRLIEIDETFARLRIIGPKMYIYILFS